VFAFYFLSSLNMLIVPYAMVSMNPALQPLSYLLYRLLEKGMISSPGIVDDTPVLPLGTKAVMAQFSLLQYLIPLILLVIAIVAVFPRLAIIVRRKREEAPALDPADIEKLKGE
jgi:hypothetical protein